MAQDTPQNLDVGAVGARAGSGATTAERSSSRQCPDFGTSAPVASTAFVLAQPRFAPKFWGVAWDKRKRRWRASYVDGTGRRRVVGFFVRGADSALAVNAAIRAEGLTQRRKTNPVVDGRPVPRPYPTAGD